MSEVIPERVSDLREKLRLSQANVGALSGTSQASIQRIENGETRNPRNLLQLAQALQTSPEYLIGDTDDPISRLGEHQLSYRQQRDDCEDTVELQQIDLRYGMGGTYADGPVEVETRQFSREWLRSITSTAPSHLFWATGDGDSMEPTIRTGEVILIDRSQDTPRLDDGIWAVTHGEIGMIKRLRHLPDGTVELHSDNHLVRPQSAVDGELHIVGRVIAVVRKL